MLINFNFTHVAQTKLFQTHHKSLTHTTNPAEGNISVEKYVGSAVNKPKSNIEFMHSCTFVVDVSNENIRFNAENELNMFRTK